MPDLRIAIVGPESSGKTTLAQGLYAWLGERGVTVELVVEQGRQLAQELPAGHAWSWREQRVTSLLHRAAEERAALMLDLRSSPTALIADGSAGTPLVWHMCAVRHRPRYDAGPPDVTEQLVEAVEQSHYDLVFVTAPDIPWVADGIRDDPAGREEAFELYRALYPHGIEITGDDRLGQAVSQLPGYAH